VSDENFKDEHGGLWDINFTDRAMYVRNVVVAHGPDKDAAFWDKVGPVRRIALKSIKSCAIAQSPHDQGFWSISPDLVVFDFVEGANMAEATAKNPTSLFGRWEASLSKPMSAVPLPTLAISNGTGLKRALPTLRASGVKVADITPNKRYS
jgi:hypothetical protein